MKLQELTAVPAALYAVAKYPVTAVPPLFTGGVQVTVSDPTPDVATTFVGGSGGLFVVTEVEAADGVEDPEVLIAFTWNV
jgi:hypothetical protein